MMDKQRLAHRDYGLGEMARWWIDQETVTFQFPYMEYWLTAEAQIINIDSIALKHCSWSGHGVISQ